jgi:hypothetical protein
MAQKRVVPAERPIGGAAGGAERSVAGGRVSGVVTGAPGRAAEGTLQERIRRRAYEHYLRRGGAPGDAMADWCRAEREILEEGDA